jgi:lipoprotein-anchoring transpeptidase ErfK/SrfK
MQHSPRVLRASALATALAGLIALATPFTDGLIAVGPTRELPPADVEGPGEPSTAVIRSTTTAERPEGTATLDDPAAGEDDGRQTRRRAARELLVQIPAGGLAARRNPWSAAPVIGRVTDRSRYYGVRTVAWIEELSAKGRWGRVELPYVWPRRDGWIRMSDLQTDTTRIRVLVDVSAHRLTVRDRGEVLFRAAVATGRSSSPTPVGEYFVTDRVPFPSGSAYGSFAFGISGIQPRLPAGWTGGDQLAIHGTNAPSTIGTNASAGCVRASEATLSKLKPLLRLGTPVVIGP